jgi:hypothetical protein
VAGRKWTQEGGCVRSKPMDFAGSDRVVREREKRDPEIIMKSKC